MTVVNKNNNDLKLHCIDGGKFKTNTIGLLARIPLSTENTTKTALLAQVLKNGCKAYPSRQAVAIEMEQMYGAVFDVSIIKKGDEQILFFYLEVIDQDELLKEAFEFLNQYINFPNVKQGKFDKKIVENEKEAVRKTIRAQKDNKRAYAKQLCIEMAANAQPFGISADGYEQDLEKIDAKDLYSHFNYIINNADWDMFFLGSHAQSKIANEMVGSLGFSVSDKVYKTSVTPLPHSNNGDKKEVMEVAQGRLCMAFTTEIAPNSPQIYALILANELLGGTATSLLFSNVREKKGLCYYISSTIIALKGMLIVETGISPDAYKEVVDEIKEACNLLADELVDNEKLAEAKKSLTRYYTAMLDSPSAIMNFTTDEMLLAKNRSIKNICTIIDAIKPIDVSNAAKQLRLSASCFLQPKGEN